MEPYRYCSMRQNTGCGGAIIQPLVITFANSSQLLTELITIIIFDDAPLVLNNIKEEKKKKNKALIIGCLIDIPNDDGGGFVRHRHGDMKAHQKDELLRPAAAASLSNEMLRSGAAADAISSERNNTTKQQ